MKISKKIGLLVAMIICFTMAFGVVASFAETFNQAGFDTSWTGSWPNVTFTLTADKTSYVAGDTITFTANFTGVGGIKCAQFVPIYDIDKFDLVTSVGSTNVDGAFAAALTDCDPIITSKAYDNLSTSYNCVLCYENVTTPANGTWFTFKLKAKTAGFVANSTTHVDLFAKFILSSATEVQFEGREVVNLTAAAPVTQYKLTFTGKLNNDGAISAFNNAAITALTGNYNAGSNTINAPMIDGYNFVGWYSNSTCTTLITANRALTVNVSAAKTYFPLYAPKPAAKFMLTVCSVNNAGFKVGSDNTVQYGVKMTFEEGSTVTLTKADTNFYAWLNDTGKIVTDNSITVTMDSAKTITIIDSMSSSSQACVIFRNSSSQALAYQMISASTTELIVPNTPFRFGYDFQNWQVLNASGTAVEATLANLKALVGKKAVIDVYPNETTSTQTFSYKVYEDGALKNTYTTTAKLYSAVTATATKNGKAFKYWALDPEGTQILGYNTKLRVYVFKDTNVYAIYSNDAVTAVPVATLMMKGTEAYGLYQISLAFTYNIPASGYSVNGYGVIYNQFNNFAGTDEEFVIGAENVSEAAATSATALYSGAVKHCAMSSATVPVKARAYVKVTNTATGVQSTIYSDVMTMSFADLA